MNSKTQRIDWAAAKQQLQETDAALERALAGDPGRIEKAYEQRATQMANRHIERAASAQVTSVLVFSMGAETYGIPLTDLVEILPPAKCTPVPRAAPEVEGVINLREELRSVIHLRRLLSLPPAEEESASFIVILKNGGNKVGLRVGKVDRVQAFRPDEIVSFESNGEDGGTGYFRGLSPGKVIILNTAALLSHPAFQPIPRPSSSLRTPL